MTRRQTRTALRRWITSNDLTQRDLARRLRVSEAHVCNLLKGTRAPSAGLALRIMRLTGLHLEDIAG